MMLTCVSVRIESANSVSIHISKQPRYTLTKTKRDLEKKKKEQQNIKL